MNTYMKADLKNLLLDKEIGTKITQSLELYSHLLLSKICEKNENHGWIGGMSRDRLVEIISELDIELKNNSGLGFENAKERK